MRNKETEKLFKLAYTDAMTGVYHRNAYEEKLEKLNKDLEYQLGFLASVQKKLSNDMIVDAFLHMPEPNGNIGIDSKFPLENYQNMVDKNSQIKSSLLISFISCSAKLPIYLTMVLALFSGFGVWVIFGMYLLGIVLAVIMAIVLEKTILPTGQTDFIIEFPPLRFPKFFEIFNSVKSTCKQFLIKVFGP